MWAWPESMWWGDWGGTLLWEINSALLSCLGEVLSHEPTGKTSRARTRPQGSGGQINLSPLLSSHFVSPVSLLQPLIDPHASATWKGSQVNVPKGPHSISRDRVLQLPHCLVWWFLDIFHTVSQKDFRGIETKLPIASIYSLSHHFFGFFTSSLFLICASWDHPPSKPVVPRFLSHHFFLGET